MGLVMENRVRERREKLGLTQEELARKVEVRRETIVFLEQGKYNPSLRLAWKIAQVLGTRMDKLFSFQEN